MSAWPIQPKIFLVSVSCLALAVWSFAYSDEEVSPRAYVATAGEGVFYFKMVPKLIYPIDPQTVQGAGHAYRVLEGGQDELLWSTSGWYAYRVCLSDDGRYLVRLGNWPRGRAPSAEHLAIAFYDQGKLLKSYSTKDLILDPDKIQPSVSHYQFVRGTPHFVGPYGYAFQLITADGVEYRFDVRTGAVSSRKKLVE